VLAKTDEESASRRARLALVFRTTAQNPRPNFNKSSQPAILETLILETLSRSGIP